MRGFSKAVLCGLASFVALAVHADDDVQYKILASAKLQAPVNWGKCDEQVCGGTFDKQDAISRIKESIRLALSIPFGLQDSSNAGVYLIGKSSDGNIKIEDLFPIVVLQSDSDKLLHAPLKEYRGWKIAGDCEDKKLLDKLIADVKSDADCFFTAKATPELIRIAHDEVTSDIKGTITAGYFPMIIASYLETLEHLYQVWIADCKGLEAKIAFDNVNIKAKATYKMNPGAKLAEYVQRIKKHKNCLCGFFEMCPDTIAIVDGDDPIMQMTEMAGLDVFTTGVIQPCGHEFGIREKGNCCYKCTNNGIAAIFGLKRGVREIVKGTCTDELGLAPDGSYRGFDIYVNKGLRNIGSGKLNLYVNPIACVAMNDDVIILRTQSFTDGGIHQLIDRYEAKYAKGARCCCRPGTESETTIDVIAVLRELIFSGDTNPEPTKASILKITDSASESEWSIEAKISGRDLVRLQKFISKSMVDQPARGTHKDKKDKNTKETNVIEHNTTDESSKPQNAEGSAKPN